MERTIKISEESYRKLLAIATELQRRRERKMTFDDAIQDLVGKKVKNKKLSDLAGSWKMSDSEWMKIKDELKRGWKKWKIPSV